MTKVLVATEKPFAAAAVNGIRGIVEGAGFELVLLEKYTDPNDLVKAVADVDALILRSDKATPAVIEAGRWVCPLVEYNVSVDETLVDTEFKKDLRFPFNEYTAPALSL